MFFCLKKLREMAYHDQVKNQVMWGALITALVLLTLLVLLWVNNRRIKEACRRLNDRANYDPFTIEAIGQSVGFSSRSAFSKAFKQITGLMPGAYRR